MKMHEKLNAIEDRYHRDLNKTLVRVFTKAILKARAEGDRESFRLYNYYLNEVRNYGSKSIGD